MDCAFLHSALLALHAGVPGRHGTDELGVRLMEVQTLKESFPFFFVTVITSILRPCFSGCLQ